MFSRSARLYDAIYSFKDYAAEAAAIHELVQRRNAGASTLLDVACGTGVHLAELRRWYRSVGLDADPELLAVARERLGDVELARLPVRTLDRPRDDVLEAAEGGLAVAGWLI